MLDEYHEGMITVHLYFVGVSYLKFKYPNCVMQIVVLKQRDRALDEFHRLSQHPPRLETK